MSRQEEIQMDLHKILRDPECKSNIQCSLLAFVFVIGGLCLLIYGLTWMSSVDKTNTEFYGAKHLENRITILENNITILENHTHQYYNGKIKQNSSSK